MAVNPRFEVSSSSPDGVPFGYSNMQRSHFTGGPNPDRGSSFRDNHDSRMVVQGVAGTSFPGSGSSGRGELQSLCQILSLDLLSSGEHKYGLRRAITAAVGLSDQDQMHGNLQPKSLEQQGSEELKRIKASLFENASRARERARGLSEAMSKLDKYRASLHTRKRVRSEPSVHERPITSLSVERPTTVGNSMKASFCPSPNHVSMADGSAPKPEDKNKGGVPNKRVRTSMVDVRIEGRTNTSSFQRSVGLADRERDSLKSTSSLAGSVEDKDRAVSTFSEGWEKTKMKGRRSGTKSDAIIVTSANGNFEVERERNNAEIRSRPSEGHGFRSGPVHGVVSLQKVENSQQNGTAVRSVNKSETDALLSVGEKGDRFVFPEKERLVSKNGVKISHREEGPLASPRIVTKAKASRAPRSSAVGSVNPSAHTPRPSQLADSSDRAPSRAQLPIGPSNRKRPVPSSSSSPPVAQWVGQRPQKMARIARRIIRDEAVSTGEGNSAHDGSATVGARSNSSMPVSAGFDRRIGQHVSLSQNKLKAERVTSSIGLSESDDSEGGCVKFKEKGQKHGDSECKFAPVNQNMGPLVVTEKKSKEEIGDGVRRQGRSGRGLIAGRESCVVHQVETADASANAKQLRSARPGIEKLEKSLDIKPGRPPTKKGTGDRKHLTRPRRPAAIGAGDISGASDDDHEELVASVKATVNASAEGCPNEFWKEIEAFFAYVTPDEHEHLKKQVRDLEEAELSLTLPGSNERDRKTDAVLDSLPEPSVLDRDGKLRCFANDSIAMDRGMVSKVFNNLKNMQVGDMDWRKAMNGDLPDKGLPLSQRLLAALIIEDDSDDGSQDELQECTRDESSNDLSDIEQVEGRKQLDSESEVETRRGEYRNLNGRLQSPLYNNLPLCNGNRHSVATNSWHKADQSEEEALSIHLGTDLLHRSVKAETIGEDEQHAFSGLKNKENQNIGSVCGADSWDVHYQSLKLDDRIVLELQSVGLYADLSGAGAREDDEIDKELNQSHVELKDQVHSNKENLMALERLVSNCRVAEERKREHLAMLKLVENTFIKRLGHRGGALGASGNKSSASKGARAAALALANRTLARWRHFVETGQSCFTDAGLRDILFCVSSKDGEVKALTNDGEALDGTKSLRPSFLVSSEMKSTGSGGTGQSLCYTSGDVRGEKESSEGRQIASISSELIGEKDDIWSHRPIEREAFLEEVVDVGPGGIGALGTKGKRSDRERDGKGQCKEIFGRSDINKCGRQGLATIKGERKTKTKPRQKTAPLLKAVNGLLGKPAELPKENSTILPMPQEKHVDRLMKARDDLDGIQKVYPEAEGGLDLSHLQIPSMDDLVGNSDLAGQGQDFGTWLDFEDPGLPDAGGEFMGLDVPMDDLSDLAMMM